MEAWIKINLAHLILQSLVIGKRYESDMTAERENDERTKSIFDKQGYNNVKTRPMVDLKFEASHHQ